MITSYPCKVILGIFLCFQEVATLDKHSCQLQTFDPKLPPSTAGWLSLRAVQFQCCEPLPFKERERREEELGGRL